MEKAEKYFSTPCFAHAVAVLAASGHAKEPELIESGMKALDAAVRDMARAKAAGNHGDFYTWPVMFARELFEGYASPVRAESWSRQLQAITPQKLYRAYGRHEGN